MPACLSMVRVRCPAMKNYMYVYRVRNNELEMQGQMSAVHVNKE